MKINTAWYVGQYQNTEEEKYFMMIMVVMMIVVMMIDTMMMMGSVYQKWSEDWKKVNSSEIESPQVHDTTIDHSTSGAPIIICWLIMTMMVADDAIYHGISHIMICHF